MSGLIAVIGESEQAAEIDPLLEKVEHRGDYRLVQNGEGSCSLAVLDDQKSEEKSEQVFAVDGYLVFSEEEGSVLQGIDAEKKISCLIEKQGLSCLEDIEGEFALASVDCNGSSLIVRDPLGIRPLYYVKENETYYIAPEIKALLGLQMPIKEVPPGCYLDQNHKWIKYYSLPRPVRENNISLKQAEAKLRYLLTLAVEERITGVERLGVYLSGGLDSSIVAVLAAEMSDKPIMTYTVGVEGSRDLEYATLVAEKIGSIHHVYQYSLDDMLEVLPEVIYHLESFDCAYVRSAIPNYLAARQAAADGRSVMLTGEGSDEMFAGYTYLKSLGSAREIEAELDAIFKNLSRTGLQRVDRMNAAHGLECRVPFLKPSLLELVQNFPLQWKLRSTEGQKVDKWILRRAFIPELGEKVAWRAKEQFDQGSGSAELIASVAEEAISDTDFLAESEAAPVAVRNKEELYYYRIFRQYYPERVLPLVGRWTRTS